MEMQFSMIQSIVGCARIKDPINLNTSHSIELTTDNEIIITAKPIISKGIFFNGLWAVVCFLFYIWMCSISLIKFKIGSMVQNTQFNILFTLCRIIILIFDWTLNVNVNFVQILANLFLILFISLHKMLPISHEAGAPNGR